MLIPPPVPGSVSFHALLTDTSGHTRDLNDANAARALVRTVLKATRKEGAAGGGDWAAAAKVSYFTSSPAARGGSALQSSSSGSISLS